MSYDTIPQGIFSKDFLMFTNFVSYAGFVFPHIRVCMPRVRLTPAPTLFLISIDIA